MESPGHSLAGGRGAGRLAGGGELDGLAVGAGNQHGGAGEAGSIDGLARLIEDMEGQGFTGNHEFSVDAGEVLHGAAVGTLLGAGHVNIATMQVSRNLKDGNAMMFMTVDSEVGKETLKLLQGLDGILQVNLVKL